MDTMEKSPPFLHQKTAISGDVYILDDNDNTSAIVPPTNPHQAATARLFVAAPRLLSGLHLCAKALRTPTRIVPEGVAAYEKALLEKIDDLLFELEKTS